MSLMQKAENLLGHLLRHVRSSNEKLASSQSHASQGQISVSSPAFRTGMPIPKNYSQEGSNVSPALQWTGAPSEAKELVLVCEDPDAPFPQPFVHWIMYHIPADTTSLPENIPQVPSPGIAAGAMQSLNSTKKHGYTGPKPPVGHGVHHYHFQLFAVDEPLKLGNDPTKDDLVKAMHGHVLAQGEIVGTYERVEESQ